MRVTFNSLNKSQTSPTSYERLGFAPPLKMTLIQIAHESSTYPAGLAHANTQLHCVQNCNKGKS